MIRSLLLCIATAVVLCSFTQAAERPNIVFILADDLGYGDVHCFGGKLCQIETPHFDRLAAEGMRFSNAHANASVCVPTRVAIMTGRYPWRLPAPERGGPWGFLGPRFSKQHYTLGKMFKAGGYKTGYVGKWHLGTEMQTTDGKVQGPSNVDYTKPLVIGPRDHGFDYSFILPGSLDMYPYVFARNNMWVGNVNSQKGWSAFNRVGPAADDFEDSKVLSTFSNEAEKFIADSAAKAKTGEPFFLYFALTAPHTPTSPSKEFQGKSKLGIYGDFVMETDHCVGRVLKALDDQGIADNTLVIATSDHGPAPYAGRIAEATFDQLKELNRDGHYSTGGYRGYKFSVYEGGLRVPFVARWPKTIPKASVSRDLIGLPDLMATFAEVAGIQLANHHAPDSISFARLLKQPNSSAVRQTMVLEGTRGMVFRAGNYKLALCPGSGAEGRWGNTPRAQEAWQKALDDFGRRPKNSAELEQWPFVQLYDLNSDPGEKTNLAKDKPEIVASLIAMLKQQIKNGRTRLGTELPNGRNNIKPFRSVPSFVWKKPGKPNPAIKITESDNDIVATFNGKPVLRYNKSIQTSPEGISKDFERSGYIHPIYTPGGLEVTGDFPADHPHQHALFNAWTNTTFEGRSVDFWNQAKKLGRVSHHSVVSVDEDHFTVQLLHEDLKAPDGPSPVLMETWKVHIRGLDGDAFVFDITSKQTCVANSPLKMNQYRYGGMGIRGNNQWFSNEGTAALKVYEKSLSKMKKGTLDGELPSYPDISLTNHRFTTSEGHRRFKGNHSRPTWVDLSGNIDGQMAGVSILGHRRNFRFPQPVRLHPSKPYFCFAPMVIGDFEIKPSQVYESTYRYIVHDGDLSKETISRQWKSF